MKRKLTNILLFLLSAITVFNISNSTESLPDVCTTKTINFTNHEPILNYSDANFETYGGPW